MARLGAYNFFLVVRTMWAAISVCPEMAALGAELSCSTSLSLPQKCIGQEKVCMSPSFLGPVLCPGWCCALVCIVMLVGTSVLHSLRGYAVHQPALLRSHLTCSPVWF